MNVLLVDDEQLQLVRLETTCKNVIKDAEFFCYSNPLKALSDSNKINFDIAFLDIEMPGLNGIQLAKKIQVNNPGIKLIFVTAYNEYALQALIFMLMDI